MENKYPPKLITYLEEQKENIIKNEDIKCDVTDLWSLSESSYRLKQAVSKNEKILCVSDTDADGIGTYIIFSKVFGDILSYDNHEVILAYRDKGYGLQKYHIDHAITNNQTLIITADQGITSSVAVEYAKENGIDVIITDHHTTPTEDSDEYPHTPYIINPTHHKSDFEVPVSGTVVLDLFLQHIFKYDSDFFIVEKMITTISDVMPLNYEYNRDIIKTGFDHVSNHKLLWQRPYLNAHLDNNGILDIEETHISFGLAPMLNATNRLLTADIACDFVIEEDESSALLKYTNIKQINEKRKELQSAYTDRILRSHAHTIKNAKNIVILTLNKDELDNASESKLSGLLAAKISQDHLIPAMVLVYNKDRDMFSGSGRSPYNIIEILKQYEKEDYIAQVGGHGAAFGISIKPDKLNKIKEILENDEKLSSLKVSYKPEINPIPVKFDKVDMDLYNKIREYAPFGQKYEAPVLLSKVKVKRINKFGTLKQHLMFTLEEKNEKGENIVMMYINAPAKFMNKRFSGKEWYIAYRLSYYSLKQSLSFMIENIYRVKKD